MRLLSLVFTLLLISVAVIYYMKSGVMVPGNASNQPITHQEAMDKTKQTINDLNKALEKQNKQIEALEATDN
ncbi:hypothetical protein MNBD_GAMMA21-2429 [hydrothermal vent metagenome]|uniref:Uncharacterized protein n=1 Tax=hydrothermal vent metagenome TaxID=652676 RepID=A0A3B1AIW0_9ZZZZ